MQVVSNSRLLCVCVCVCVFVCVCMCVCVCVCKLLRVNDTLASNLSMNKTALLWVLTCALHACIPVQFNQAKTF